MSPCDGRGASYNAKGYKVFEDYSPPSPNPGSDSNGLMLQERLFTLCSLAPNPQKMPRVTVLAGQR